MNRKHLIAGGVALLLVLAAALTRGFGLFGDGGEPPTLYGNVDVRQVDLAFLVSGRIESIGPEEGERVKAGDILARIDKRQYSDALAAAQGQLDVAEANLEKARAGSRFQEIAQATARQSEAQAAFERADNDLKRRSSLVETGAISQQLYDATVAQQRAALAQLKVASEALSLAREGARREDRAEAAAQAKSARAQRDNARTNLDETLLHASNDGTVLTRAREPGAIVRAGETVLTLTIDRPVRIRAYVAERELSRIAPGMKVKVTADGNPKTYGGRISQISPSAEFTPKTVQTEDLRTDLVYRVRVIVDDPDGALRQGQPVTVDVQGTKPSGKD